MRSRSAVMGIGLLAAAGVLATGCSSGSSSSGSSSASSAGGSQSASASGGAWLGSLIKLAAPLGLKPAYSAAPVSAPRQKSVRLPQPLNRA